MALLSRWLPPGFPRHLETWHLDEVAAQLTWRVTSRQALGHCPVCRLPTRRLHRDDERTRADLPWAHLRLVLPLRVRKFCGANGRGTRRIFTERLPTAPAVSAPETPRLTPRRATWLVLRRPDTRAAREAQVLTALQGQHPA